MASQPNDQFVMPMSHRTHMTLVKRRLVGNDAAERVRELRGILSVLPNYKNGPYPDIRKGVLDELDATRSRARIAHRDSIAVRRVRLRSPHRATERGRVLGAARAVRRPHQDWQPCPLPPCDLCRRWCASPAC